jgi:hypothetical protein
VLPSAGKIWRHDGMGRGNKRASALVRAEHGGAPVELDKAQRRVLEEALRRGEDLREEIESKVASYGRWLLGSVFDDDASAALDLKSKNPVWTELVRRAGGPSLRVSRKTLYVAVSLAALDKRIGDQSWRGLDSGRKELLLPLGTPERLREAAKHVSRFNLTQPDTRAYVTALLKEQGKERQVRLTAPRLVSRMRTLRATLEKGATMKRLATLAEKLPREERKAIAEEIGKLRDVLAQMSRTLE